MSDTYFIKNLRCAYCGENNDFEKDAMRYGHAGLPYTFERPALVVKKFNNEMYWVVPLTSKQRPFDFYYNFTDPLGHQVALISSQLRLISIKRFKREMYRLPDTDFENLLTQLRNFLKKSEPRTGRGSSGPSESEGTV